MEPSEAVLRRIRVPFIRKASLQRAGRSEDLFVIDLGLSGLFVERSQPLDVGEAVELRFCLPENERPIVATCRVVRSQAAHGRVPAGAGLQFVTIAEDDRGRIRGYLVDYYRREPNARRFVRTGDGTDEGEI
jgi:hypothetical protein